MNPRDKSRYEMPGSEQRKISQNYDAELMKYLFNQMGKLEDELEKQLVFKDASGNKVNEVNGVLRISTAKRASIKNGENLIPLDEEQSSRLISLYKNLRAIRNLNDVKVKPSGFNPEGLNWMDDIKRVYALAAEYHDILEQNNIILQSQFN